MASNERPLGVSRTRFSLKITPRSGSIWSVPSSRRPLVVAQDAEALVDQRRVVARQIELVDRTVEAGLGIGVGAEGSPARWRKSIRSPGGQVGRALERHVLQEMGETALVVVLHQRAGLDQQAQADAARRRGIRQDGVAQAIGQPAPGDVRIVDEATVRRRRPGRQGIACRDRTGRKEGKGKSGRDRAPPESACENDAIAWRRAGHEVILGL